MNANITFAIFLTYSTVIYYLKVCERGTNILRAVGERRYSITVPRLNIFDHPLSMCK